MKCMMLGGGRLVFHLLGWSHCFVGGFQNFIICWSMFDFFWFLLMVGYSLGALGNASVFITSLCKNYSATS